MELNLGQELGGSSGASHPEAAQQRRRPYWVVFGSACTATDPAWQVSEVVALLEVFDLQLVTVLLSHMVNDANGLAIELVHHMRRTARCLLYYKRTDLSARNSAPLVDMVYHLEYVHHQEAHIFLAWHQDLVDHSLEVVFYPFQVRPWPLPLPLVAAALVGILRDLS